MICINWRYVKPWLDLDSGNTYCLFFPYSPEHLVHSVPKLEGLRPDVSLSIYASLKEHKHVSGSASALFIGGFSVMEMGKVWHTIKAKLLDLLILLHLIAWEYIFAWHKCWFIQLNACHFCGANSWSHLVQFAFHCACYVLNCKFSKAPQNLSV